MVGMNDGVMPQPLSSSSLITDEEKRLLEERGSVELSPTSDILQMDEAFVCYIAMTRACEQMTFHIVLWGCKEMKKRKVHFKSDSSTVQ